LITLSGQGWGGGGGAGTATVPGAFGPGPGLADELAGRDTSLLGLEDGGWEVFADAPCTGCGSVPPTSCPMIHASSTTATTDMATAATRLRQ
jgi:hypothetical protein